MRLVAAGVELRKSAGEGVAEGSVVTEDAVGSVTGRQREAAGETGTRRLLAPLEGGEALL